ncbi:LIC_13387 family protein [Planctobacterium marinum]|uniref:Uncharacterized protein n=1 Tax=Planctobacterium marinum TaxID=1631968 RepID=A0AA48KSX3_9ALTE|nr:hypothetical protein MACH26_24550 [Planctobacterium marinum]
MAQVLMLIGVSIFGVLGTVHLLLTFFSNKFDPFEIQTKDAMMGTSPRLTKDTSIWHAWIGFNASHSLGALFFAAIYLVLLTQHFSIVSSSIWLSIMPILVATSYLYLAYKYWFKVPMAGILLALICFVASAVLINF